MLTSKWHRVLTAKRHLAILIYISGATLFKSDMPVKQAKQKVTLYLPDELHRQFKIRSAIDGETMSLMAQRAIEFYLDNVDLLGESSDGCGQSHRIHACPKCAASVAIKGDELDLIHEHSELESLILTDLDRIAELRNNSKSPDEGELITC